MGVSNVGGIRSLEWTKHTSDGYGVFTAHAFYYLRCGSGGNGGETLLIAFVLSAPLHTRAAPGVSPTSTVRRGGTFFGCLNMCRCSISGRK